ncbi:MAG: N-acetyltransferase [Eubacteriales bacterium]|nr:N-acetyltransferase [Eubacteriales bacterium]
MIRELKKPDIDEAAGIWLDTNIKAHDFIPMQYWQDNFNSVKQMFLQAEIYVFDNDEVIQGFIGLNDNYIAGIFVSHKAQSQGIGKLLLDFVKNRKEELYLSVYQKNTRAICFYQREGFEIQSENMDENTEEKEYVMIWKK